MSKAEMENKVKIITAYTSDRVCKYQSIHCENVEAYARKWGHEAIMDFKSEPDGWHPYWLKSKMALREMKDCDWVLWMDADTLFMDMGPPLDRFMVNDVVASYTFTIECGVMMFRNSPRARTFLESWRSWHDKNNAIWKGIVAASKSDFGFENDNIVLSHAMEAIPNVKDSMHLITDNSFVTKHVHIHDEAFIVHIPGSPEEQKLEFMELFSSRVKK